MQNNTNQPMAITSSERGLSLHQAFIYADARYLMLSGRGDPLAAHYAVRANALAAKLRDYARAAKA
jgi:hypothetical protein